MRAVGIIAEYNPLHNGHVYHIEKAKQLSGADSAVIAMSGDFVQRGEPAVLDKWTRTEHALKCGADLVLEIPVLFCLGNAGQYGRAGVRLLESSGLVSHIAFGSESGDTELLRKTASELIMYADQIADAVKALGKQGYSYPAAREAAYFSAVKGSRTDSEYEKIHRILNSSNDILALEYIMAARSAEPLAVKRAGAGYNAPYDMSQEYQSASAIRQLAAEGSEVGRYVPGCVAEVIGSDAVKGPDRDRLFDILRYAVMSSPAEFIDDCPSGGEGLGNLMKKEIYGADNIENFVSRVRSKRYTYTRISRLCMQVVLGITRSAYTEEMPGYIRVLGFSKMGRELLAEMKNSESATLPVITNINKEKHTLNELSLASLELDKHSSDIYNLICGNDVASCGDNVIHPVISE